MEPKHCSGLEVLWYTKGPGSVHSRGLTRNFGTLGGSERCWVSELVERCQVLISLHGGRSCCLIVSSRAWVAVWVSWGLPFRISLSIWCSIHPPLVTILVHRHYFNYLRESWLKNNKKIRVAKVWNWNKGKKIIYTFTHLCTERNSYCFSDKCFCLPLCILIPGCTTLNSFLMPITWRKVRIQLGQDKKSFPHKNFNFGNQFFLICLSASHSCKFLLLFISDCRVDGVWVLQGQGNVCYNP